MGLLEMEGAAAVSVPFGCCTVQVRIGRHKDVVEVPETFGC